MNSLRDRNILVTGGCGSIGSELIEHLVAADPAVVRVLDTNEAALFDLQEQYGKEGTLRYLLGSVRDRERLGMALEDIDVVFHAAALKHVELNEYNPFEAVQTNVQGTQNLVRMAMEEEVDSFVNISTDKASNPVSVMGATKLLSERLVIAANAYKGSRDIRFGCVRFGNVLGSSGSVVPLFMDQIRDGGPVTVTDPDMTRFIMPVDEAAGLVLEAHERMTSGEVFVLKMPAFRVGDLAEAMVERYAPTFGHTPAAVDVEVVGTRPAERVHEKLVSSDETLQARELDEMYVILPQIDVPGYLETNYSEFPRVEHEYTSADQELLTREELVEMIDATERGRHVLDSRDE
jgi:FlaA1/EpsC-like NDP-sugar epimerase